MTPEEFHEKEVKETISYLGNTMSNEHLQPSDYSPEQDPQPVTEALHAAEPQVDIMQVAADRFTQKYSASLGGNTAISPEMIALILEVFMSLATNCMNRSGGSGGSGGGGLGGILGGIFNRRRGGGNAGNNNPVDDEANKYIRLAKERNLLTMVMVRRSVRQHLSETYGSHAWSRMNGMQIVHSVLDSIADSKPEEVAEFLVQAVDV